MPNNIDLADRVRFHLADIPELRVEEKAMFRGLAFMVNGKMCVNISGDNLMCRVDPLLYEELSKRKGYLPMIMKGKQLAGYCYVAPEGYKSKSDFAFWMSDVLSLMSLPSLQKLQRREMLSKSLMTS